MVKKIVMITLAVILVSAIGVAAYDAYQGNSTLQMPNVRALASSTGLVGQGGGQGQGMGQGRGQGQGGGQGLAGEQGPAKSGQGQGGGQDQLQSRGQGQGGNGTGEPVAHDWLNLTGTVTGLDQQGLWVDTAERGELLLSLGRPGFADEQAVTFTIGDAVTVQGFDSPEGQFVAGVITNDTTTATLMLRDPNGRPLWAGRGQGQGGGQGQGRGQGNQQTQ